MGIEPTSEAWEASILPLNYARSGVLLYLRSYRPYSPTLPHDDVILCVFGCSSCVVASRRYSKRDDRRGTTLKSILTVSPGWNDEW